MVSPKDEDFALIKQDLINEIKGMRSDMNRYFEKTDTHEKALFGDKFKETGLMEDNRNLKKMAGVVMTACTGVVGLFGEFVFRTFFHHPKGG